MRKLTKRALCILAASAISISGVDVPFVVQPAIVSAATFESGDCSTDISQVIGNTTLFFKITNANKKTMAICGCKTTSSGTNLTVPKTITKDNVSYTVTSVATNSFKKQTNLSAITFNAYLSSIDANAFEDCTKLKTFNVEPAEGSSSYSTVIGNRAFSGCTRLSTPNIPYTYSIGDYAFAGCKGLNSVKYNYSLHSIGVGAFMDCFNVESIDIDSPYIKTIPENCFSFNLYATSIKLPTSVTTIGKNAFSNCQYVETIYIPESCTRIENSAFNTCVKLKTFLTPDSIDYIGNSAFQHCPSLKYFVCKNPKVTIGGGAFGFEENKVISDFVVWGNGGNVEKYATDNKITYHNISEAAAIANNGMTDYKWSLANVKENFNNGTQNLYYIDDKVAYLDVSGLKNKTWKSSELGLAAVSALLKNGEIKMREITDSSCTTLPCLTSTKLSAYTKSYVNIAESCRQNPYVNDYYTSDAFNNSSDSDYAKKEMVKYIEFMTYGADVSVLSFDTSSCTCRETVRYGFVCYGLEWKENACDKNSSVWISDGFEMDARLLLYRPGDLSGATYTIYINTKTGSWYCPFAGSNGYRQPSGSFSWKPIKFSLSHSVAKILQSKDEDGIIPGSDVINELYRNK